MQTGSTERASDGTAFANALKKAMKQRGNSAGDLACQLHNHTTGKTVHPRRIGSWLGEYAPQTYPSPPILAQLIGIYPELEGVAVPTKGSRLNRGPALEWIETPEGRVRVPVATLQVEPSPLREEPLKVGDRVRVRRHNNEGRLGVVESTLNGWCTVAVEGRKTPAEYRDEALDLVAA